jgi:tetratricopeptide (TPR) repeat protein
MNRLKTVVMILIISLVAGVGGALAQETTSPLIGKAHRINTLGTEYQGWNNCGPATLTNALVHFGYENDQNRAATWLKPDREDKNVSPWQMVEFVNTQVPEIPVFAISRSGGTADLAKVLLYNNFPVIIEKGYTPDGYDWMGHYLLLTGYDDSVNVFSTMDSFIGPKNYSYDEVLEKWQHFNYTYIVLYTAAREAELMELLGDNGDEWQNHILSLEIARAEATADPTDAHAWFNMGTNFVKLGMYDAAAQAYDQSISLGLPWRMMWYQFGPYEALLQHRAL